MATDQTDRAASRRDVLRGAAVAGVAGVAGFTAYALRDDSAATGYPTGGGGPQQEALVAVADLPADGGVVVQEAQVVVVRDGQNQVRAFSAVCTHQGCLVSRVVQGVIVCPCHGSQFDAATGAVVAGPAAAALPPVAIALAGDTIVRA